MRLRPAGRRSALLVPLGLVAAPLRADHRMPPPALAPEPPARGAALRRFHDFDAWQGRIAPGVLRDGAPEVRVAGRTEFRWTADGTAVTGELRQEHFDPAGRNILTWTGLYTAGWDARAGRYRVLLVDRHGWAEAAEAAVQGDRFVVASPPYPHEGRRRVDRVTLRAAGDGTVRWTKETSTDGGPWVVTEEMTARRTG